MTFNKASLNGKLPSSVFQVIVTDQCIIRDLLHESLEFQDPKKGKIVQKTRITERHETRAFGTRTVRTRPSHGRT
jgi:hypothetical protein